MKIIITNSVPLNGGDAAILQGMVNLISKVFRGKNISFIVFASQAEIAQHYYPQFRFSEILYNQISRRPMIKRFKRVFCEIEKKRFIAGIKLWNKENNLSNMLLKKKELQTLFEYKSATFIISTGGTYLVENYNLEPRLLDFETAIHADSPLIFFTQSLGPFNNPNNRHRLKKIFKKSLIIFVRDQLSKQHLLELGVESYKIFLSSDAAFYLADKSRYGQLMDPNQFKRVKKVAISFREWPYFKNVSKDIGMERYQEAIKSITRYLVETQQAEVIFISTCQGIPEYWLDDSKFAAKIVQSLPAGIRNKVTTNHSFHQPQRLIEILDEFDMVIATRMHMAILSLCAGTPVFPIAYEFKTQELFKQLGLEQWVQDIEKLNANSVVDSLASFINELPCIASSLYNKVDEAKKSALSSGLIIKKEYDKLVSL